MKPRQSSQILSRTAAESELRPYMESLNKCIQGGWDAYDTLYKSTHHILSPRARAAIVFDHIVHLAEREFAGAAGVNAVRIGSTSFMLYIGDHLTVRFKKIRKDGRCSNIRTRQQALFLDQAQLELPGMLSGTLLHAGYSLDPLQQRVQTKAVVCLLGARVLWMIELPSATAEVVTMQPKPYVESPSRPSPRFILKGEASSPKVRKKAAGIDE